MTDRIGATAPTLHRKLLLRTTHRLPEELIEADPAGVPDRVHPVRVLPDRDNRVPRPVVVPAGRLLITAAPVPAVPALRLPARGEPGAHAIPLTVGVYMAR